MPPRTLSVAIAVLTAAAAAVAETPYVPPRGAGYVNARADAGAVGDGRADDTAALKAIIEAGKHNKHARFGACRRIYIPEGTYVISEPIVVGDKKKAIFGAGRGRTILRLADRCRAFAGKPTAMLDTRGKRHFAQNFFQRIRGMTFDVGEGNPNAVGLEFHTNNGGGVYDVTICSGDPAGRGAVGLSMTKGSGPGLIRDVTIEGFDVGCLITGSLHSMAFSQITLRRQGRAAFENRGNTVSIEGLRSENVVPAVRNRGGHMVLLNARLTGGGRAATAITNEKGTFFARGVTTAGYDLAARMDAETFRGPEIAELAWPRAMSLFGEPGRSLNLPVVQPPMPPMPAPGTWTVVHAESGDLTGPLQRAIDSGARDIFVSSSTFGTIRDTIHVRGRVRRISGAPTIFRSEGFTKDRVRSYKPLKVERHPDKRPVWRIEDGESDVVLLEFLGDSYGSAGWGVEHATKRTLILLAAGGTYRNTVTGGRVFFIDGPPGPGTVLRGPQQAWAWHTNTESYAHDPHILNDGARLWILGIKTEKDRTIVKTTGGGCTEVLGGLLYKNRERIGPAPAFVSVDSSVSLSYKGYGRPYQVHVREARGGETRDLPSSETFAWRVPVFNGIPKRPAAEPDAGRR